jgi:alkylation response protein AidB-like acyl-CoA dehydrogenase
MLADAVTEIEIARTMLYKTAWLKELGRNYNKEAARQKCSPPKWRNACIGMRSRSTVAMAIPANTRLKEFIAMPD